MVNIKWNTLIDFLVLFTSFFAFYFLEFSSAACLAELGSVGLTLNTPDNHGVYPIHYAVRLDQTEVNNMTSKILFLKKLVSMGVDLNVADDRGLQPIHWAVCMGNKTKIIFFSFI